MGRFETKNVAASAPFFWRKQRVDCLCGGLRSRVAELLCELVEHPGAQTVETEHCACHEKACKHGAGGSGAALGSAAEPADGFALIDASAEP